MPNRLGYLVGQPGTFVTDETGSFELSDVSTPYSIAFLGDDIGGVDVTLYVGLTSTEVQLPSRFDGKGLDYHSVDKLLHLQVSNMFSDDVTGKNLQCHLFPIQAAGIASISYNGQGSFEYRFIDEADLASAKLQCFEVSEECAWDQNSSHYPDTCRFQRGETQLVFPLGASAAVSLQPVDTIEVPLPPLDFCPLGDGSVGGFTEFGSTALLVGDSLEHPFAYGLVGQTIAMLPHAPDLDLVVGEFSCPEHVAATFRATSDWNPSFTVSEEPSIPELIAPATGGAATAPLTFEWSSAAGVSWINLTISGASNYNVDIFVEGDSVVIPDLTALGIVLGDGLQGFWGLRQYPQETLDHWTSPGLTMPQRGRGWEVRTATGLKPFTIHVQQ